MPLVFRHGIASTYNLIIALRQMSDRTGALQGANQISAGANAPVAPPLEPPLMWNKPRFWLLLVALVPSLVKVHKNLLCDKVKYVKYNKTSKLNSHIGCFLHTPQNGL